jgi:hypothetical protein
MIARSVEHVVYTEHFKSNILSMTQKKFINMTYVVLL